MTNAKKYKTLEEREAAFKEFCCGESCGCENCQLHGTKKITIFGSCALQWLELEAKQDKND